MSSSVANDTALADLTDDRLRFLSRNFPAPIDLIGNLARALLAERESHRAACAKLNALNARDFSNFNATNQKLRAENALLREALKLMISYLNHEDQDANHGWMVMKMREALNQS